MNTKAPPLPSQAEMAEWDRVTIASGVTSAALMDRAGLAVAAEIASRFPREAENTVVLCGPGHNGGDGYVVAKALAERGNTVTTIAIGSSNKEVGEKRAGFSGRVVEVNESGLGQARDVLTGATLAVDALLGTGQKEAPRGVMADLIRLPLPAKVVSVDLPTGVDGDSGRVFEPHINASVTDCIEAIKRGLLQYPAREACGTLVTVAIGLIAGPAEFSLLDGAAAPHLRPRRPAGHKGDFGKVLIIGGSAEMPGAAWLCVRGAVEAGAGLVTKAALPGDSSFLVSEALLHAVKDWGSLDGLCSTVDHVDAVVIGPGLGRSEEAGRLVSELVRHVIHRSVRAVLDADGLNLIAEEGPRILGNNFVITPHPGEAARLLKSSPAKVQENRYHAARELALRYGCVSVLKGASTVLHDGRRGFVNSSGNPYMATAGSGDVLSGMLAAFLAGGEPPMEAARISVYAHGLAGDIAHSESGSTVSASRIADCIPKALSRLV